MTLLLLGGTAEAKLLARGMWRQIAMIYSIAGLVRKPNIACEVVSGGFKQFGGLNAFVAKRNISAILDVTHPFAQQMSRSAAVSASDCAIPCWRYSRPAWRPLAGDNWWQYANWDALSVALKAKKSVFLTVGQLTRPVLETLVNLQKYGQRQLVRTAVKPVLAVAENITWIEAIGPFSEHDERKLMDRYHVDLLVCKNSGGDATVAKLVAARERGITVYMLQRPNLPAIDHTFTDLQVCKQAVLQWYKRY